MTQTATLDFSIPAIRTWRKLPEGVLAEVINGTVFVSPSPTPYHARVSGRIFNTLKNHVDSNDLGEAFSAPVDVILRQGTNVVVPDIIFIFKGSSVFIDRKGVHGPPELLIEILSPGTRRRDLTIKKNLYEKAGVKEYWVVDPETKKAQGYLLQDRKYGEPLLTNSEINIRILKKVIQF